MKKTLLMFASLLFLLPNAPYLLQAWRYSRLDRWDAFFYLLSIPAAVFAARKLEKDKYDCTALCLALPAAVLFAGKGLHHIHALSILGSLALVWSLLWLISGWKCAVKLLPVFVILALGTPSTTYQTALLLKSSAQVAVVVKFVLAAGCFAWIFSAEHYNLLPSKNTLFFGAAAVMTAIFLFHAEELYFSGRKFFPRFPMRVGPFIGRAIEPDANTRKFFATSEVRQYRYAVRSNDIAVLAVLCGKNVHEIHPASHCLRTAQWEINSEKLRYLRDDFAVTEIDAAQGSARILVWVWYSSTEFSTASFTGFRKRFRPGVRYGTWQISTQIKGDINKSREILQQFINALPMEVEK